MRLFKSFSNKEVDAFSREMAEEVFRIFPLARDISSAKRKASRKNPDRDMDVLLRKASAFQKAHRLGIYKRARLANTFQWALKEHGYDELFIETCTQKLVIAVSNKSA